MAHIGKICRWDVFWADLEPHVGTEQAGESRPVLVVSSDEANALFGTVTVVPLTKLEGKDRLPRAWEVLLPGGTVPNRFTPLALPHHIRSVSKMRLLERAGALHDVKARFNVERGILEHLDIGFEPAPEQPALSR
ncbi:MAG TPA: type II toxin-antitoxin system PemK/MazF family toxin [Longimicrobium sp.]|nr:type II toxin-antitoxin system PemK/MazF family toxin [Longimicrobium sp.]